MLSWFRKGPPPPKPLPNNPGSGRAATAAFTKGSRTWNEKVDLLTSLSKALSSIGHAHSVRDGWLALANGLTMLPQVVGAELLEDSGLRTVSTVQVAHPTLAADGLFDYQHSTGNTLDESFSSGFEYFAEFDLPVFLDALAEAPQVCTFLSMTFPEGGANGGKLYRRAVLGPPAHYAKVLGGGDCDDHPFCACCLLTNSYSAFQEIIASQGSFGLRLYALREENGDIGADCRINGEDWAAGVEVLCRYAQSWPGEGFEVRKQYVLLHTATPAQTVMSEEVGV